MFVSSHPEILGGQCPDARYRIRVYWRGAGERVLMPASAESFGIRLGGF